VLFFQDKKGLTRAAEESLKVVDFRMCKGIPVSVPKTAPSFSYTVVAAALFAARRSLLHILLFSRFIKLLDVLRRFCRE